MPTTRYTVFDGEIVSESRAGVLHDYVPDSLGNTIALLDGTQTQTDQWAYFPYGEATRIKGTTATPMLFVGNASCRQDSSENRSYMRNRVLDLPKGRWMTIDPMPPKQLNFDPYGYASCSPTTLTDPWGLSPQIPNTGSRSASATIYASQNCVGMSPGACYVCAYPSMSCEAANALCGSHTRCGPGAPVVPAPEYGWVDCMANCIKQHDPLSNSQKIALTLAGGTVFKSWCKSLGIIPKYNKKSPLTTIPSIIQLKLKLGGRSPLRSFGRFWSPI